LPSWNLIASHVEPQIDVEMAKSAAGERKVTVPRSLAGTRQRPGAQRNDSHARNDRREAHFR
jgi:hypothetical protein